MNGKLDLSGLHKLRKDLKEVTSKEVDWGFPDESDMHSEAKVSLGRLAIWQEEGTHWRGRRHIPPRPAFQESLLRLDAGDLRKALSEDVRKFLLNRQTPKAFLDNTGETLVESYRGSMISWHRDGSKHNDNAASTIKRKGFNQPYLETGELVRGVKFKIKSRTSKG